MPSNRPSCLESRYTVLRPPTVGIESNMWTTEITIKSHSRTFDVDVLYFSLSEGGRSDPGRTRSELAELPRRITCRGNPRWRYSHGAGSFDLFESQPTISVSRKALADIIRGKH
jgi:hypothetical protein